LSFLSVGDVISTSSRMVHGSNILQIFYVFELTNSSFLEHVESSLFNKLSDNFESDLVSPLVHKRHRQIIDKNSHRLVLWRREIFTYFKIAFGFDGLLEHQWRCCWREIDSFKQHFFFIEFVLIHQNWWGLGGSRSSYNATSLLNHIYFFICLRSSFLRKNKVEYLFTPVRI